MKVFVPFTKCFRKIEENLICTRSNFENFHYNNPEIVNRTTVTYRSEKQVIHILEDA